MKNRYLFFKSIYKDYIMFFIEKRKLNVYDIDNTILSLVKTKDNIFESLEKNQINYVIIDNLDIVKIKTYKNNNYKLYKKKAKLFRLIYSVIVREYYINKRDQLKN